MKSHVKNFNQFVNEAYYFTGNTDDYWEQEEERTFHEMNPGLRSKVHKMLPNSAKRGKVRLRDEFRNATFAERSRIMQLTKELDDLDLLDTFKGKLSNVDSLDELSALMLKMIKHHKDSQVDPGLRDIFTGRLPGDE